MSDLFNWFCGTTREYVESLRSVPKGADGVSTGSCKGSHGAVHCMRVGRPADSEVSASLPSAPGAELGTGREGTVAASPAVPSFQDSRIDVQVHFPALMHNGFTIERLIADVERIANETK